MSKIKSLEKQVEDLAKTWYIKSFKKEHRREATKEFMEDEDVRKDVIEQYLESHPNVKKQYEEKKKIWFRAKMIAATAGVIVIGLGGAKAYTYVSQLPSKNAIEQETEFDDNFALAEEEKQEENEHKKFFEEARRIENTKKREDFITNKTNEVIAEAYNKENCENLITADRLDHYVLNELVLEKTDRLGNRTYERVPQNEQYEQTESQKLIRKTIYVFAIDGKTVAVFDSNEDVLFDENVEKQDMSFKDAIKLVKQSEKLKDIYKYPSNDNEKDEAEQKYAKIIKEYEGQKDIDIAKGSQERE